MTQHTYRLHVGYAPIPAPAARRRSRSMPLLPLVADALRTNKTKPAGAAVRGMVIGLPMAALLWAPIVWGLSHLF